MKNKIILLIVLIWAFVFRLVISPKVFNGDLIAQASWGDYVANAGPKNLYYYNVWTFSWPNHPPLTSLYYGFCFNVFRHFSLNLHHSVLILNNFGMFEGNYFRFVDSFDRLVSPEVPYPLGYMLSLKLFPVLADILIGLIVYLLAVKNKRNGFKYLLAYLLLPFSWYISALWGQTDQLAFLFVLVSFLILVKYPFWSILLLFIGGSLKPTSIFLVPLFLFVLYKSRPKYIYVFMGVLVTIIFCYLIFNSFTSEGVFKFTFERLLPRLFDKPLRLTTNAFNFWHIFVLHNNISSDINILFLSGKNWGLLILAFINLFTFRVLYKVDLKSIIFSLFVVSFGSWLFATEMLDRYVFAGVVSGLLLSVYYPKIFKHWLILCFIFSLNLFRGWWYPNQLFLLKNLLEWNNYSIGLFFSLANTILYFKIILIIVNEKNNLN